MPEQQNQSGMTLVEILVAMVMMGIIITGVYNLFRVHNLMAAKQEETTMMQQELLSVMADITDELRMCGFNPTGSGSFGFNSTGTNQTAIYCTRGTSNQNNSTDIIAYMRNSTSNELLVFMSSEDIWVPAGNNISDLRFTYFDNNGTETANLNQVRMVQINATALPSSNRAGLGINSRNMHTRVWLRNMGLN